jgi:hypothetical protein
MGCGERNFADGEDHQIQRRLVLGVDTPPGQVAVPTIVETGCSPRHEHIGGNAMVKLPPQMAPPINHAISGEALCGADRGDRKMIRIALMLAACRQAWPNTRSPNFGKT